MDTGLNHQGYISADEQNSRRLPDAATSEWRIQSGEAVVTVVAVLMKF